jgi:hypothetical protein
MEWIMTRINLDAMERGIQHGQVRQVFTADELFAVVADLRAARKAVEASKRFLANRSGCLWHPDGYPNFYWSGPQVTMLVEALADYDEAVGP